MERREEPEEVTPHASISSLYTSAFLAIVMTPAAASQDDFLVIPGVRIGPISLGMTLREVEKSLGYPKDHPVGNIYAWQQYEPGAPLMVTFDAKGRVSTIKTYWDTFYETRDGLGVGRISRR